MKLFPESFLRGGSVAVNQVEEAWNLAGNSISTSYVQIKGLHGEVTPRHFGIAVLKIMPSISVTQKILNCLRKWDSESCIHPLHGHVSIYCR